MQTRVQLLDTIIMPCKIRNRLTVEDVYISYVGFRVNPASF